MPGLALTADKKKWEKIEWLEVFPSRWHESIFIYSETSTCSALIVSYKSLGGSLWYWERMEERRGEERRGEERRGEGRRGEGRRAGHEWVSAARPLDAVLRPLSPLRLVYVQLHITHCVRGSISEHFCFPGQNAEPLLSFGGQSNGDHSTSWWSGAWHLRTHPVSARDGETPESSEKQQLSHQKGTTTQKKWKSGRLSSHKVLFFFRISNSGQWKSHQAMLWWVTNVSAIKQAF